MIHHLDTDQAKGIQQCLATAQGQNLIRHFQALALRSWNWAFNEFKTSSLEDASIVQCQELVRAAAAWDLVVKELDALLTGTKDNQPTEYLKYE